MKAKPFFKLFFISLILMGVQPAWADSGYAKIVFGVFKTKGCPGKAWEQTDFDTSKSCVNYSYVDSKGKTTNGSNGHFRCYADKVVFDKYPFASNCDPKAEIINRDHAVPASADGCLEAPSHEGPVYERIIDYTYPGSEDCKITKARKK